ncbi:MAG: hypothetical protein J0L92_17555 [Deltaproteobacteria bacterium]|nr:hypothetical protein [Deltaproteobacteria bacterium]
MPVDRDPGSLNVRSLNPDSKEIPMPTDIHTQNQNSFKAALEARRAVLDAMPEGHIQRPVRLDLIGASETVISTLRGLTDDVRIELVAEYGDRVTNVLDGLETDVRAARQADAELATKEESADVGALHEEVMAMYERLLTDATSLVHRGFLPKERLAAPRDLKSYQGTLQSLLWVIEIFRDVWPSVASETPVKTADLDRADDLASRMADALGKKQHGALRAVALETRTRAFSYLVRQYEELRRMVTFVRWFEGDFDKIVPSLYAGRGQRKPKVVDVEDDVSTDDEEELTSVPGPVPNNGGPAFSS